MRLPAVNPATLLHASAAALSQPHPCVCLRVAARPGVYLPLGNRKYPSAYYCGDGRHSVLTPTYPHTTPPAPVPPVPADAFPTRGAPTGSADLVPSTIYTLPRPAEPHNTNSNRVMTSPIRSGTASAHFRSAAANNASAPTFNPMNNGPAPTFTPLLQAPGPASARALCPLPSALCPPPPALCPGMHYCAR